MKRRSKQRSSSKKLPNSPFLVDECVGAHLFVAVLRQANIPCERLLDHFESGTTDDVWMPEIAGKGWLVLTKDDELGRDRRRIDDLCESGLKIFTMVGTAKKDGGVWFWNNLAENIVALRQSILRFSLRHPAPFIGRIYLPSNVPSHGRQVYLWKSREKLFETYHHPVRRRKK